MSAHYYRLVGLERLNNENYMSATIEPFANEQTQKAFIEGSNEFKDAVWNYCQGNWGNLKALCYRDDKGNMWVHKVEHID